MLLSMISTLPMPDPSTDKILFPWWDKSWSQKRPKSLKNSDRKSIRWSTSILTKESLNLFPEFSLLMRFTCWILNVSPSWTELWSLPWPRSSSLPPIEVSALSGEPICSLLTVSQSIFLIDFWLSEPLLTILRKPLKFWLSEPAQKISNLLRRLLLTSEKSELRHHSDTLFSFSVLLRFSLRLREETKSQSKILKKSTLSSLMPKHLPNYFKNKPINILSDLIFLCLFFC